MKPCDVILDSQGLGGSNNLGWSKKDGLFLGGKTTNSGKLFGHVCGIP